MDVLNVLIKAAKETAQYLRSEKRSAEIVGRGSFGDVSKQFDIDAEDMIIKIIRDELGDNVVFVTEERQHLVYGEKPEWLVIMDPVDGSTNYEAGIPWASIALAISPYRTNATVRDIVAAVVAEVFRDNTYTYLSGRGVYFNNSRVVRRKPPSSILLGYFEQPGSYDVVPNYFKVRGRKVAIRSLGSAALDIVYVGLGRAEGFADLRAKLRNVDVAASIAIAKSLGAKAFTCDSSDAENIRIDEITKVECIVVGYDNNYANMLLKAAGIKP